MTKRTAVKKADKNVVVETRNSLPLVDVRIQNEFRTQAQLSRHVVSKSVNGKEQQRHRGERIFKNIFMHSAGTICSRIDNGIASGRFTRSELATFAGTNKSMISTNIAHHKKPGKINSTGKDHGHGTIILEDPVTKKLSFADKRLSAAIETLEKAYQESLKA